MPSGVNGTAVMILTGMKKIRTGLTRRMYRPVSAAAGDTHV